jgi:hypothetical protein
LTREDILDKVAEILVALQGLSRDDAAYVLAAAVEFVTDDDRWKKVLDE